MLSAREQEAAFYEQVYAQPGYSMRKRRKACTVADLAALPWYGEHCRGSLLDVGCGRGEMLDEAEKMGFVHVMGVDVVPAITDLPRVMRIAGAHDLGFTSKSFDVVTMFDVIEHLIPGDDELACREMLRVACKHVMITASNNPSLWCGRDLHINKRPYTEWDGLFREWFKGCTVSWLPDKPKGASERWRIDI